MNREILFRGKRIKTGKWGYGDLIRAKGKTFVGGEEENIFWMEAEVYPGTVGQYTGLCDKNGKKIFEGDKVESRCGEIGIIEYLEEDGMFIISFAITSGHSSWIATFGDFDGKEITIIGNIHDNPELVKEVSE